jgi:hypothetical protein
MPVSDRPKDVLGRVLMWPTAKVSSPLKKAYRRDYSFDEGVEED